VLRKAATVGMQTQVQAGPGSTPTSTSIDPTLDVCRDCLDSLSDDERGQLERIIEKMFGTL
jgi:hypothetical protein